MFTGSTGVARMIQAQLVQVGQSARFAIAIANPLSSRLYNRNEFRHFRRRQSATKAGAFD